MMEARLPHQVVYQTSGAVPIEDVIESLRGTAHIAQDAAALLETFIPGFHVDTFQVIVREISQSSPLREAFTIAIVALYQEKIGQDMPKIINDLFGIDVPKDYSNVISLLFIVIVFYSGMFLYGHATRMAERPRIKSQLDDLIAETAARLGVDEEAIRKALENRYKKSGVGSLISATRRFLTPSKRQDNAPVDINNHIIPREAIAEFPSLAQSRAEEPGPTTHPLENVEIHLHAQDVDRQKQGWAAVVPILSSKRIPMQLMPPLDPAEIYTKESLRGDILVETRTNNNGDSEPVRIHLIRVRGS